MCVPMVVEAYDAWGTEAMESLSLLASCLVTSSNRAKAEVLVASSPGPVLLKLRGEKQTLPGSNRACASLSQNTWGNRNFLLETIPYTRLISRWRMLLA